MAIIQGHINLSKIGGCGHFIGLKRESPFLFYIMHPLSTTMFLTRHPGKIARKRAQAIGERGQKVGLNTLKKEMKRCIQRNNIAKLLRFMKKPNP